jgi:hypothetical protein
MEKTYFLSIKQERAESVLKSHNARSARIGAPALSWDFGHTSTSLTGEKLPHEYLTVTVRGEVPVLAGWKVIASYFWDGAGYKEYRYSYEEIPANWANNGLRCDHCLTNRRRNVVFALRNEETGETKAIGSTCLTQFTGCDVRALEHAAGAQSKLLVSGFQEAPGIIMDQVQVVTWARDIAIMTALRVIREHGFTSKKNARQPEDSTAHRVTTMLLAGEIPPVSGADALIAMQVNKREYHQGNEYESRIASIMAKQYVDRNDLPFICAEANRGLTQPQKAVDAAGDEYFGAIGDRMPGLMAFVEGIASYETQFGTCYVVRMRVANCLLVWKTSTPGDVRKGELKKMTATIKEHNEYKGERQTTVSRVTWQVAKAAMAA